MGLADDVIDELEGLQSCPQRIDRENGWRKCARFVHPSSPMSLLNGNWPSGNAGRSTAARESRYIYDSTPLHAARQLTNSIVSILTPSTSYWHDYVLDNLYGQETPHNMAEWLEHLRDHVFTLRYNPATRFAHTNQVTIRQAVCFGNGLYRVNENHQKPHDKLSDRNKKPFSYRHLPLMNTYIGVTAEGVHDTTYEVRDLTAKQIVKHFGEANVSAKIIEAANKAGNKDTFCIVHGIRPRDERGSSKGGATTKDTRFASYIIERDTKHIIEDSGYYEFPDVKYGWEDEPGQAYSTGPVEMMLATIEQTNAVAKTMLIGGQRSVEPPLMTPANPVGAVGVAGLPPLDLRPNATNPGYLANNGAELAKPIMQGQNPGWAQGILDQSRQSVREGLFLHLFQVLQDNPNQSATEALIREQEKGELLGPVGQSIQSGLSTLVDREIGILSRRGAFEEGSPLAPPPGMDRIEFSPEYTSPLDRARRASQAVGIQRVIEMALPLAEHDPTLMMNFDANEIIRTNVEILGAPKKMLRSEDERDALIKQQQDMQQAQQLAQLAQQGGAGAQALAGAVTSGAEAVNATAGAIPAGADIAGLLGAGAEGEQGDGEFLDLEQTEFEEL